MKSLFSKKYENNLSPSNHSAQLNHDKSPDREKKTTITTKASCGAESNDRKTGKSAKSVNTDTVFNADFASMIWMTYRFDFPRIQGSSYNSDAGWGCMLRSGQMLLANTLYWCYSPFCEEVNMGEKKEREKERDIKRKEVIKLFFDSDRGTHPFSIHNLIAVSDIYNKKIGEWYSPHETCIALQRTMFAAKIAYQEMNVKTTNDFPNVLTGETTLYIDEVIKRCSSTPNNVQPRDPQIGAKHFIEDGLLHPSAKSIAFKNAVSIWEPCLILITMRLGIHRFDMEYADSLIHCLQNPYCVGIIGGKPRSSLYFVGSRDDTLIYLDPHTIQKAVNLQREEVDTYSCKDPQYIKISEIDPSLAIGFYCKNRSEFDNLIKDLNDMISKCKYPIFYVEKIKPTYLTDSDADDDSTNSDEIEIEYAFAYDQINQEEEEEEKEEEDNENENENNIIQEQDDVGLDKKQNQKSKDNDKDKDKWNKKDEHIHEEKVEQKEQKEQKERKEQKNPTNQIEQRETEQKKRKRQRLSAKKMKIKNYGVNFAKLVKKFELDTQKNMKKKLTKNKKQEEDIDDFVIL